MTCSAASTLTPTAAPALLPASLPTTQGAWQHVRTSFQQLLQMVQGAAGATGTNIVPQQYTLPTAATVPPMASLSNCTVTLDATKPLFGQSSYKVAITGSPATIEFSADTAWPIHPGWQWIVSFFQQASAAIAGVLTITTPAGTYATDFQTTTSGFQRLYDALNIGGDSSTTYGLSFTFTGGSGQNVWLAGLMLEPYFNTPIQPSPYASTSSALTLDNEPDGFTYVKLRGSHASGNVAYNYKGVWSSSTSYVIGDEVVYGSTYWLAIVANTNSAPPNSNWQAVGTYGAFEGAWSSATAYSPGAEVTYNGNFWVCVTANTNSAPTTSNANWQIAGPASLDDIADGSTYARTLASGLSSGKVATAGIVTAAVTNYAITVDGPGSSNNWPYTTTTIDEDMESVSNTTAGGAVEVDVSGYISISIQSGMGVTTGSYIGVWRDGSFVGTVSYPTTGWVLGSAGGSAYVNLSIIDTPTAGAHTYTFHAHLLTIGGSGTDKTILSWSVASIKMREFKR